MFSSFWGRRFAKAVSAPAMGQQRSILSSRARPGVERLEDRLTPSTLIPVANHRDLVFDPVRDQLDITTASGQVVIFNVQSQQVVNVVNLASSPLDGADTTPDGSALYVANPATNGTQGVIYRLNLSNFQVNPATYTRASGENGAWDLALGPRNIGLLDTLSTSSAPLHQINMSSNTLSFRSDFPAPGGKVPSGTLIARSADRSLMLFAEPNGSLVTYNAITNGFTAGPNIGGSLANALTAVNRNGTLFAVEVNGQTLVMDPQFHVHDVLYGYDAGIAFDPNQDVLYAANSATGQLSVINTNTWAVQYQLSIGENIAPANQPFGNGVMAVSSDSKYVFLATPTGIREIALPNFNPAVGLVISNFTGVATAGTPFTMTVTMLDAYGNVATGYTGTVHFTTSDTQGVLPADYTFTIADGGVHTFSIDLKTAHGQQLTIKDTQNLNLAWIGGVSVSPGAVTGFWVAGASVSAGGGSSGVGPSYPQAAGYAFTSAVGAHDAYNNLATNYTGTVHFASSDPSAVLPADYTFTAGDQGVHPFSATLWTAGYQTITATDTTNSAITGGTTVAVADFIPGLHFAVSTSQSSVTAGTALSVTITALDQWNNVATPYVGTLTFSSSDQGAGVVLPADYTFTAADAGVHTFTVTLVTATPQAHVDFHDTAYMTGAASGDATVAVTPTAASTFTVTGFPSPTTAGSTGTVTVTALDPYGNVATGYTGTVHFTSSDAQAILPDDYTFTADDNGVHSFSVALLTAGVQSLTVTDAAQSTLTASQTGITVNSDVAAFLLLTAPSTAQAGVPITVTLTVTDAYGNVVTGYAGTVQFQSTDAAASLPDDYAFTSSDQGQAAFQVTFWTPGIQTLSVSDGTLTGSTQVTL
jgi:hypothetical protein